MHPYFAVGFLDPPKKAKTDKKLSNILVLVLPVNCVFRCPQKGLQKTLRLERRLSSTCHDPVLIDCHLPQRLTVSEEDLPSGKIGGIHTVLR